MLEARTTEAVTTAHYAHRNVVLAEVLDYCRDVRGAFGQVDHAGNLEDDGRTVRREGRNVASDCQGRHESGRKNTKVGAVNVTSARSDSEGSRRSVSRAEQEQGGNGAGHDDRGLFFTRQY